MGNSIEKITGVALTKKLGKISIPKLEEANV